VIDHFRAADRLVARVPGMPGIAAGLVVVLRILAVVDAVALGAVIIYWIRTLPQHGALLGAMATAWLLYRGIKRACRAIFEFDEYRWMTLWLARYALVLLAASMLVRGAYWLLESGRSV
jgi:hypothetical protein